MKNSSAFKDNNDFNFNGELQQAIERYSQVLENLANKIKLRNNSQSCISLEEDIFNVLRLRDEIQRLVEESPVISIHQEQTLTQLDKQLKNCSKQIKQNNKHLPWIKGLKPLPNYWSWFIKPNIWNRFDKVCDFFALICLTAFASYIATILPKFAVGGFSFFKNLGILATSGLTLGLIITLVTQRGRNFLKTYLSKLNINPKFHSELTAIISLWLVICLLLFDLIALPSTSNFYLEKGKINLAKGQLNNATYQFKQALEFNDRNYKAHLYLGLAYEFLDDFIQAKKYYNLAIKNESPLPSAYNNLARIYIFENKYDKAEQMLTTLKQILDTKPKIEDYSQLKFTYHKNLAWLKLERYQQKSKQEKSKYKLIIKALDDIEKAIDIRKEQKLGHRDENCIYAAILYEYKDDDEAKREVDNCSRNNQFDNIIDRQWITRLEKYSDKPLTFQNMDERETENLEEPTARGVDEEIPGSINFEGLPPNVKKTLRYDNDNIE
jgi:tetratricopeptide (TPR) repeat protein